MRRIAHSTVALFALLLPAFALPAATHAQAPVVIRIGGTPTDGLTPMLYAVYNGLYKKAGLDVQFFPTASGTIATAAVVAGTYEMGTGSAVASMNAHLKNLPLVVIANSAIWDAKILFNELLVAADSPIKSGADLSAKTIGVPALNDLNTLVISAWTDKNGGDSKTLKFVEVPNSVAAAALIAHRIDADALQEPELTSVLSAGGVKAIAQPYSAISPHFAFGVYFANRDWAQAHLDAVRTFVRVTYQAAAYTNVHHAESAIAMSHYSSVPLDAFAKMARVDGATSSDASLMQPFIDAAAKYHLIPSAFPAKEMYFQ